MARVPSIIVHGGAGADPKDGPRELRDGMSTAVEAGWRMNPPCSAPQIPF